MNTKCDAIKQNVKSEVEKYDFFFFFSILN